MSRTGRKPIAVPDKVKVSVNAGTFLAEGPLGKEEVKIHPRIAVTIADKNVTLARENDEPDSRSLHGMMRALLNNAVQGVSTGFTRELEINGVGYRAEVKGTVLNLTLGFSHPVNYDIPKGIKINVDKQTKIAVTGSNRELVGRVSANIRSFRPPEPYKGKGIKYVDETIVRKVGKAAGGK
jgi:large subunit ribosomal protein L6